MIFALLTTLLVIPSVLGALLVVACTQGYTARVPSGPDAMGLAAPLFLSVGSSIVLLLGAWACAASGGFGWISDGRGVGFLVASVAAIGVGLAAVGVLVAWIEKAGSWVVPTGLVCGAAGPVAMGVVLIASAWLVAESERGAVALQIGGVFVGVVAIVGMGFGAYGARMHLKQSAENAARVLASHREQEAEWERRRGRTPIEALREDFATMSDETPLWVFVAGLPDTQDGECRRFIIERAMRVPGFELDLAQTLTCDHPRYRHGCVDLIRYAPEEIVKSEWATPLAKAIDMSAAEIERGGWLETASVANPSPIEHVRGMIEAAGTLKNPDSTTTALRRLRDAIELSPKSAERDEAFGMLEGWLD